MRWGLTLGAHADRGTPSQHSLRVRPQPGAALAPRTQVTQEGQVHHILPALSQARGGNRRCGRCHSAGTARSALRRTLGNPLPSSGLRQPLAWVELGIGLSPLRAERDARGLWGPGAPARLRPEAL